MKKIKFSRRYSKLLDDNGDVIQSARLLHVQCLDLSRLNPTFLNYDTDNGKYKLPQSGSYMMLIFLKPQKDRGAAQNLFTTLRRYTPDKFEYYVSSVGMRFEVVVEEKTV